MWLHARTVLQVVSVHPGQICLLKKTVQAWDCTVPDPFPGIPDTFGPPGSTLVTTLGRGEWMRGERVPPSIFINRYQLRAVTSKQANDDEARSC